MAKAKKAKEICLTMANKIGLLSEVTRAVSKAKVNIAAICAYEMEGTGYFMMIADSPAKAKKALASLGGEIKEEDVISVEMANKPGELEKAAKKIADAGIDIEYLYATAGTGKTAFCVFKTADDKKAIKVIK